MILYNKIYEREGNDAWFKDYVELHNLPNNSMGLYLYHKQRWSGWGGDINADNTLELDANDIENSQKLIDEYIDNHSLHREFPNGDVEGISINLKELLCQ